MKATIRRRDTGGWELTRPVYGFAIASTVTTEHPTWRAAMAATEPRFLGAPGGPPSLVEYWRRRG